MIRNLLLTGLFCVSLMACQPNNRRSAASTEATADSCLFTQPAYARGFRVCYRTDSIRLVEIQDPQGTRHKTYRFALVPPGKKACVPSGYTPVTYPVQRVLCMTSLQLSNFISLDACERVTGITSTRHLFHPKMRAQLKSGYTCKIGIEGNFDNEAILAMQPDVIFISPFKRGGYETLRETDLPLVPHLGYQETTPLGQAEWIKLIGLFIGCEAEAEIRFAAIEQRYQALKKLTASVKERPVVFSGELRGGNWYAVGGRSFLAQLFRDAGADYFLKDDEHSGGVTLDFETVYSHAAKADYWRIVNSYNGTFTYDVLKASDARYADFQAFQQHKVLYCNMKQTPFYESMPMEPDVVLADLIHAFHPRLNPNYQPRYYRLLP